MNEPRTTSPLLFLTVLSACVGLWICGAPALAHAQQTAREAGQSPSARDEVKCQDEATLEVKGLFDHEVFIEPLAEFVADIGKLISINKYDITERSSHQIEVNRTGGPGLRMRFGGISGNKWLEISARNAAEELAYQFSNGDEFYRYDEDLGQDVTHTDVTFLLEDSGLVITAKHEHQSPELARKYAAIYNSYFSFASCPERSEDKQIFYQNTKALSENNQVLIVTRLPRAALAKLMAKQPAAN